MPERHRVRPAEPGLHQLVRGRLPAVRRALPQRLRNQEADRSGMLLAPLHSHLMFRRIFLNFVKLRKGNQQFGKRKQPPSSLRTPTRNTTTFTRTITCTRRSRRRRLRRPRRRRGRGTDSRRTRGTARISRTTRETARISRRTRTRGNARISFKNKRGTVF